MDLFFNGSLGMVHPRRARWLHLAEGAYRTKVLKQTGLVRQGKPYQLDSQFLRNWLRNVYGTFKGTYAEQDPNRRGETAGPMRNAKPLNVNDRPKGMLLWVNPE